MSGVDWVEELKRVNRTDWPAYLDEHSGLPGPRGNIELAMAVAELADPASLDDLISSGDEFRTFCGVIGLTTANANTQTIARLRSFATDERWRVREAVAMALQRLGDRDFPALEAIVLDWADDPNPLVQRAAAAAICEPRLLNTPEAARVAIEVCRRGTAALAARPPETRKTTDVRTLRQGLGYCWSVAIVADPVPGLVAFHALDESDPDISWIIKTNLSKKRLARIL